MREFRPQRLLVPRWLIAGLLAFAFCAFGLSGCVPGEVRIETPENGSRTTLDPADPTETLQVEIDLGEPLAPTGSLRVTLLAGVDTGGAYEDVSAAFVIAGATASASLPGTEFGEGRNILFVSVDHDGDGAADAVVRSSFAVVFETGESVARIWNEVLLDAIRVDTPRPTVHARNLFHLSVAMWDCWVAYDHETPAAPYLYAEKHAAVSVADARHACISHAAHRLLNSRFVVSIGGSISRPAIRDKLQALGYDPDFVPADGDTSPEAVGFHIGQLVIDHFRHDGANQIYDYADPSYTPYNGPLIFKLLGTGSSILDPNRWAPLAFDFRCLQNGIPVTLGDDTQVFVGSNWDDVWPFALTRGDPSRPYLDPGAPPQAVQWDDVSEAIVGPGDLAFKQQMLEVVRHSSGLNPDDAPMIDTSPRVYGSNSLAGIANGVLDGTGHPVNPVTGLRYAPNWVNQADYGRVIAEFWADGPESETPPGHWNTLANYIADHPLVVKRIAGSGPLVDDLEWDVKAYLAVNGAVHDAAIAAWGAKALYDYVRPVAGIRWLSEHGQSSDPGLPSYSVHGMLLEDGLVELITAASSAPGERHAHLADHVDEIAMNAWPGEPSRELTPECGDDPPEPNPDIPPYSGREWILGEAWITYQRRTFVTPPFAAYISGHSAFSRAAAEVLTRLTGSAYFPGGLGEFVAPQNDYLVFEVGPTETLRMQWATYQDAADEAGISRLWGGIHVSADDFEGRLVGYEVGIAAFERAQQYWNGTVAP